MLLKYRCIQILMDWQLVLVDSLRYELLLDWSLPRQSFEHGWARRTDRCNLLGHLGIEPLSSVDVAVRRKAKGCRAESSGAAAAVRPMFRFIG